MAFKYYLISLLDSFSNEAHQTFSSPFLTKHSSLLNFYSPEKFSFRLKFLPTTKETNSEWFLVFNEPFQNINYFGFEFSLMDVVSLLSTAPWWSFFLMYMPFFFTLLWGVGFFVINFISVERSRIICLIMLAAFSLILLCFSFYAAVVTPKLHILDFYSFDDIVYFNGGLNKTPLHSKLLIPNYKNKQSAAVLNYLSKDTRLDEILNVKPVAIEPKTAYNCLFTSLYYMDLSPQHKNVSEFFNLSATNLKNNPEKFTTLFNTKDENHIHREIKTLMDSSLYKLENYPQTIGEGLKYHSHLDEDKKKHIVRAWYSNLGVYNPSSKEHVLAVLSGCCWSVLVSLLGCIGVSYRPNKNRLHAFTVRKNNLKSALKSKFYYKLKMREIYYVHGGAGCMEWSALEKLPKQKKLKHVFEDLSKFTLKDFYHLIINMFYTRAPYLTTLLCLVTSAAVLPLNSPATSLFFLNGLLLYFVIKANYPLILNYTKDSKINKLLIFGLKLYTSSKQSFGFFTETTRISISEIFINSLVSFNVAKFCVNGNWWVRFRYALAWLLCSLPISWVLCLKLENLDLPPTKILLQALMAIYFFIFLLCFIKNDVVTPTHISKLDKLSLFLFKFATLILYFLITSYLLFVVFYGLTTTTKLFTDYGTTRMYGCWFSISCLIWISAFFSKLVLFSPAIRKLYTVFVLFFYIYTIGDFHYTPYILTVFACMVIVRKVHTVWHINNLRTNKIDCLQLFDFSAVCALVFTPFVVIFIYFASTDLPLQFTINTFLASTGVSLLLFFCFFAGKEWRRFKPLLTLLPFALISWFLCCAMDNFTINAPGTFYRTNALLDNGWVLYLWLWSCLFLWRIIKYYRYSEFLAALVLVVCPFVLNLVSSWQNLFIITEFDKTICILFVLEIFAIIKYLFSQITYKPSTPADWHVDSVRVFSFLLAIICYTYISLFLCLNLFKYSTLFVISVITVCCMYSALLLCIVVITDLNRTGSLRNLQGSFTGFRYLRKLFYIFVCFLFLFICLILCNFV